MAHVEESRLERAHQFQSRDRDQHKKILDKDKAERAKLQKQAIRNDLRKQTLQSRAKRESTRKRKNDVNFQEEKDRCALKSKIKGEMA